MLTRVSGECERWSFAANGGFSGMAQGLQRRSQQLGRRRSEGLWCPLCLCVLTHIPVLDGLMNWLRMFHWCLVRLEREAGGTRRGQTPSELDAAVFQLTLEVRCFACAFAA